MVQIDPMTVSRDGQCLKEFANPSSSAVCPAAKVTGTRLFSPLPPTKRCGPKPGRFLDHVIAAMPYPLRQAAVQ